MAQPREKETEGRKALLTINDFVPSAQRILGRMLEADHTSEEVFCGLAALSGPERDFEVSDEVPKLVIFPCVRALILGNLKRRALQE